ncbi:type II CAAX endopeptidase family protein [Thermogemmatispora sp.]|uniref:CPBP family intramembrane glutamic endopeptidase n=1 Tax=Thermogemmatispora sp. TaxID=1968838 RepID=UPI002ACC05D5|nr:type II CAAX endopeptidase family protein [Thermogemmatispora sp.]
MEKSQRIGIIAYLLITFAGAWLCWGLSQLAGIAVGSPLFQGVTLLSGFMPAIAALIVRLWITREGLSDAGLSLSLRGGKWRYYLFALLLPLINMGLIISVSLLFGIARPDLTLQHFLKLSVPTVHSGSLPLALWPVVLLQLLIFAVLVTPILWGEEFGWRSYLQLRLCARRPLLAAIVTGVIWGCWHLPLIFMGYEGYPNPWWGSMLFILFTIGLSIIFGWLRLRSGSIWASSLAHAATNVIGGDLSAMLFAGDPRFFVVAYHGVLSILLLSCLAGWLILSGRLQMSLPAKSALA